MQTYLLTLTDAQGEQTIEHVHSLNIALGELSYCIVGDNTPVRINLAHVNLTQLTIAALH